MMVDDAAVPAVTDGPDADLFPDLTPDELPMIEKTLCMNCHATGVTNLLLTKVPYFKEIILMHFRCGECGYSSTTIQSAGEIAARGHKISLSVTHPKDLQRQVVKSEWARLILPELEFEIPAGTQKGVLSTVEGFLSQASEALRANLPAYMAQDHEIGAKISEFIIQLSEYQEGENLPFTVVLDDISGTSFVENPNAPSSDPNISAEYYYRTTEQNHALGLYDTPGQDHAVPLTVGATGEEFDAIKEVVVFESDCMACKHPGETRMKVTDIPHFKEVIIMSFVCDKCGHKSNEVKSGGGIEPKGSRMLLRITDAEDLKRDVLKSETASVEIPELELELEEGTLGGKFTTVEGLLSDILEGLRDNPFVKGDSAEDDSSAKFEEFLAKLAAFKEGNDRFTLILDDPVGNSYIQNVYAPDEDPEMEITHYERTFQQNEDLGLNDMRT